MSEGGIEVDSLEQFSLGQLFVRRMGDVDGTGAQEQRLSPGGKLWDVGGELGNHGWKPIDGTKADEGDFEGENNFGEAFGGGEESFARGSGITDETDEGLRFGVVGDDVGGTATLDEADVKCAWPDLGIDGKVKGEDAVHEFHELMDGAFAEFGIGGVSHGSRGFEDGAKSAFGGESETVVGRLAVDEEAAAFGIVVGDLGSSGVTLFSRDEEKTDAEAFGAEDLGGCYLGGGDAFGVTDAAAVEVFFVFTVGDVRRDGVDVGGEDEIRAAGFGAGIDVPARVVTVALDRLRDGGLFNGPASGGEEGFEKVGGGAFVIGSGLDLDKLTCELNGVDGQRCTER